MMPNITEAMIWTALAVPVVLSLSVLLRAVGDCAGKLGLTVKVGQRSLGAVLLAAVALSATLGAVYYMTLSPAQMDTPLVYFLGWCTILSILGNVLYHVVCLNIPE